MASLELAAVLHGLHVSNINAVSAISVLAYEIVITSGQEIRHIWRASWTVVKVVYIITRYYALAFLLLKSIVATNAFAPDKFCNNYLRFEVWGSAVLVPLVDIIIIARIYALYNRSTHMALLLATLWLTETLGSLALLALATRPLRRTPPANPLPGVLTGCFSRAIPDTRLMLVFWALVSATQATYVALTMLKFVAFGREFGFAMSPLLAVFFRDGAGYFLIVLAVNLLNMLLELCGSVELQESGDSWLFAITAITACRLVLNLRRTAQARSRRGAGAELRVIRLLLSSTTNNDDDDDDDSDDEDVLPK